MQFWEVTVHIFLFCFRKSTSNQVGDSLTTTWHLAAPLRGIWMWNCGFIAVVSEIWRNYFDTGLQFDINITQISEIFKMSTSPIIWPQRNQLKNVTEYERCWACWVCEEVWKSGFVSLAFGLMSVVSVQGRLRSGERESLSSTQP